MALSDALVIGPDRQGRRICVEGGLVNAAVPPFAAHLACPQGEIGPGNVCAHTHLYSGLAAYAMPAPSEPPTTFLQILERVWWRLDRALDEEILRAAAEDYIAKALLAGTTTLIDHHESPGMIEGSLAILGQACQGLGIRALLCYGATERNFGAAEAERGLAECRRLGKTALVRPLVGLHASFTVSDHTIQTAGNLAREMNTAVHIHVAEDGADVADANRRGFRGPLERLLALGALVPGSILAHGVHLDAEQVRFANSQGCWLVHNPRSNEGNRSASAAALGSGSKVALGTDGWEADMAVEEAALRRLGSLHGDDAVGGRLAAGHTLVAEHFGAKPEPLTPGALGDLVVREDGRIRHVVVGGRLVVTDGALIKGSKDEIADVAARQATRLWRRMAAL